MKSFVFICLLCLTLMCQAVTIDMSAGEELFRSNTGMYGETIVIDQNEEVARGNYADKIVSQLFTIHDTATTTLTPLSPISGTAEVFNFIETPVNLWLSSSSAEDTSGGDGIWSWFIKGVGEDTNCTSEVIETSGQTPVMTTKKYYHINIMYPYSANTGEVNTGDIYVYTTGEVSSGVPDDLDTLVTGVAASESVAHHGMFMVPGDRTWYIVNNEFISGFAPNTTFQLRARLWGSFDLLNIPLYMSATSIANKYAFPQRLAPLTRIYIMVQTSSGTNPVSGYVSFKIIKD